MAYSVRICDRRQRLEGTFLAPRACGSLLLSTTQACDYAVAACMGSAAKQWKLSCLHQSSSTGLLLYYGLKQIEAVAKQEKYCVNWTQAERSKLPHLQKDIAYRPRGHNVHRIAATDAIRAIYATILHIKTLMDCKSGQGTLS